MNAENVRVLGDDTRTIVVWERQSDFRMGDSWRAPMAAVRHGVDAFRVVEFPVHAYACATSGRIAPGTMTEPLITWGVDNSAGYETWRSVPKSKKDATGRIVLTARSDRTVPTRKQQVNEFAAARDVAVARTFDLGCEPLCSCGVGKSTYGLLVYPIGPTGAAPTRLATSPSYEQAPDAPAIAMGEAGGVAAYRMASWLFLTWLDVRGNEQRGHRQRATSRT